MPRRGVRFSETGVIAFSVYSWPAVAVAAMTILLVRLHRRAVLRISQWKSFVQVTPGAALARQ